MNWRRYVQCARDRGKIDAIACCISVLVLVLSARCCEKKKKSREFHDIEINKCIRNLRNYIGRVQSISNA
jgi:hypothetical protein